MAKSLLVEDDEMNHDVLPHNLTQRGYEMVAAVGGRESVARAQSKAPLPNPSLPVLGIDWNLKARRESPFVL